MTADRPKSSEKDRPLYHDEALRVLPLREFVRVEHSLPHRRPRFQTSRSR